MFASMLAICVSDSWWSELSNYFKVAGFLRGKGFCQGMVECWQHISNLGSILVLVPVKNGVWCPVLSHQLEFERTPCYTWIPSKLSLGSSLKKWLCVCACVLAHIWRWCTSIQEALLASWCLPMPFPLAAYSQCWGRKLERSSCD